jgi:hypothetical protein
MQAKGNMNPQSQQDKKCKNAKVLFNFQSRRSSKQAAFFLTLSFSGFKPKDYAKYWKVGSVSMASTKEKERWKGVCIVSHMERLFAFRMSF